MSDYFVHSTAVVDDGAQIGDGSKIWHFAHVMGGAVVGRDVSLGQNVFVASGTKIGNGCRIQNNVAVYEGVELEEGVFCGPSMVFTNVKNPRALFPTSSQDYGRTLIRRGATIGANATIVCGVEVGRWALIGAGATVTTNVPDHALMLGVPAKQSGWACECGRRLPEGLVCAVCGRAYREIRPGEIGEA